MFLEQFQVLLLELWVRHGWFFVAICRAHCRRRNTSSTMWTIQILLPKLSLIKGSRSCITHILGQVRNVTNLEHARNTVEQVTLEAKQMQWPNIMQHYCVWPFVHTINCCYFPQSHQVLVQNTVLVAWSGYLCNLNYSTGIMRPWKEVEIDIASHATEVEISHTECLFSNANVQENKTIALPSRSCKKIAPEGIQ